MTIFYFPFTFVSNRTLDALTACFQPIHMLPPSMLEIPENMIRAEQDGRLVLDRRAVGDEALMGEALRHYRAWARVHQGGEMGWLKSQKDTVPFYDDTSISRIRAELTGEGRQRPQADPLQEARIFLQIAQMYDAETSDIETDLESFEQMEKSLFEDLRGETAMERRPTADSVPPSDSGAFMTIDRLKTWALLFSTIPHTPSDPSPILVTTSRAVLETMLESVPTAETIASIGRIPVTRTSGKTENQWRQELADYIAEVSAMDASAVPEAPVPPDGGERTVSLAIYRIPGMIAEAMATYGSSSAPSPVAGTAADVAVLAFIESTES